MGWVGKNNFGVSIAIFGRCQNIFGQRWFCPPRRNWPVRLCTQLTARVRVLHHTVSNVMPFMVHSWDATFAFAIVDYRANSVRKKTSLFRWVYWSHIVVSHRFSSCCCCCCCCCSFSSGVKTTESWRLSRFKSDANQITKHIDHVNAHRLTESFPIWRHSFKVAAIDVISPKSKVVQQIGESKPMPRVQCGFIYEIWLHNIMRPAKAKRPNGSVFSDKPRPDCWVNLFR